MLNKEMVTEKHLLTKKLFFFTLIIGLFTWSLTNHWSDRFRYKLKSWSSSVGTVGCIPEKTDVPFLLQGTVPNSPILRFQVPVAYVVSTMLWAGGRQEFLNVRADIDTLKPYCLKTLTDEDRAKGFISTSDWDSYFEIHIIPYEGMDIQKLRQLYTSKTYPDYIGTEGDFKLYRKNKKNLREDLGAIDFLVPTQGLKKTAYISCTRTPEPAHKGERTICSGLAFYNDQIGFEYRFKASKLNQVEFLENQAIKLIKSLNTD